MRMNSPGHFLRGRFHADGKSGFRDQLGGRVTDDVDPQHLV